MICFVCKGKIMPDDLGAVLFHWSGLLHGRCWPLRPPIPLPREPPPGEYGRATVTAPDDMENE